MAKEQAKATIDPNGLVLGGQIFEEDAQATIKNANWIFGNRPTVHLNQQVGAELDGSGDDVAPRTLGIEFRASASGMVRVLMFYIHVEPEIVQIRAGAACYVVAGTCDVKFVVGADEQTITGYGSGTSGTEQSVDFDTADTGTGWLLCEVHIEKTSGTSKQTLHRIRVQNINILSSLPSPVIEGDSEAMDVQEEGSAVVLSARKLNFTGNAITATSGGSGVATVNVTPPKALVPEQTSITGTASTQVGAVYLKAATYTIRAFFGETAGAHTATLKIDANGGSNLHTFTSSAAPAAVSQSNVVVSAAGWFDIFMFTDNASGVAICQGLEFEG